MTTACSTQDPVYTVMPARQYEFDGMVHDGYGITWKSGDGVSTIEDISCSGEIVSAMARLFTLCELPPERLVGVIAACLP